MDMDEKQCGMECIRTNVERSCVKPEKGQCPRCKQLVDDSLAYIQQLESRLAQVERERDAAVKVMHLVRTCENCKHCDKPSESYPCSLCAMDRKRSKPNWEWRGVCAENTKEE